MELSTHENSLVIDLHKLKLSQHGASYSDARGSDFFSLPVVFVPIFSFDRG